MKICFIICPIGADHSEIRKRSDALYRHVFEPVVKEFDYEPIRADKINAVGNINDQIIHYLLESHLVLADLSGHNPNVFYELGIRHAISKPYIQFIEKNDPLPFDVASLRSIQIDHKDLDSVESAKDTLRKQIQSYEDGAEVHSPLSGMLSSTKLLRGSCLATDQVSDNSFRVAPLDRDNSRWRNITDRLNACRTGETVRFISITGKNFLLPNLQEGEEADSRLGPKALSNGVKLLGLVLDPDGIEAEFRSKVESPHAPRARRLLIEDAQAVLNLPLHYRQSYGLKPAAYKNLKLKYSPVGLSFGLWLFSDVAFIEPFHFGKRGKVAHLCGFAQLTVTKGTEEFDLVEKHFDVIWRNSRDVPWKEKRDYD